MTPQTTQETRFFSLENQMKNTGEKPKREIDFPNNF